MSKDQFIAAHNREIDEYLARHRRASWAEAYRRTAERAFDRMRDDLADLEDAYRQQAKDGQ